ncbi:DUF3644 domain-containing protein [bacterium]|nr:DUF3644 domain-containing protein [bacterium]
MNYRGSYRKLLGNAKAAMVAAIEVYNKPTFPYRDECFVILLLNSWELVVKALLSKKGKSIFYQKKRKEPYRTLSLQDALPKVQSLFPQAVSFVPTRQNLDLLRTYRDNAVHFYNAKGFGSVVYALAQTSIRNFRDVVFECFGHKLEEDISWQLLPLGINPPVDVITYISGKRESGKKKSNAVIQFLSELAAATDQLKNSGEDTGRLLTIFQVKLESVKKIGDADAVVGVDKAAASSGPLAIVRTLDPNLSHPLRSRDVIEKIGPYNGKRFTSYTFQAVAWRWKIRENQQYCWRAEEGVLTKYSNDVVSFIKNLSASDIETAVKDYGEHMRKRLAKS